MVFERTQGTSLGMRFQWTEFEILREEFDKIQMEFDETGNSISHKALIKENVKFYGRSFVDKNPRRKVIKKKKCIFIRLLFYSLSFTFCPVTGACQSIGQVFYVY